jgi:hypothetical protein
MSNATNTAGVVGLFGSTSFTAVPRSLPPRPPGLHNRFFKSRTLNNVEETENEEEEVSDSTVEVEGEAR